MKSHEERKSIRKRISICLGIVFALALFCICVASQLKLGFFNTKVLKETVNEYDYINKACDSYKMDVQNLVKDYGLPMYVSDRIIGDSDMYNELYFYIEKITNGKKASVEALVNEKSLEALINPFVTIEVLTNEQALKFMDDYRALCKKDVSFEFGRKVINLRNDYNDYIFYVILIGALLVIGIGISLCLLYDYKHRAFKVIFKSVIGSVVLLLVYILALLVMKKEIIKAIFAESSNTMTNIYYSLSFETAFYVLFVTILVAMCIYGLFKYLKKNI